jgi:quinoprotein glucose dehydrogenase
MFDRVTGKPIHPIEEVPVPQTKLKSEYTLGTSQWCRRSSPTQPFPTFFKPYVRQRLTEADLFKEGISEESYRDLVQRFRSLDNDNMWNPPSARGTIQNPGLNGGGEWGRPRIRSRNGDTVHQRQRVAMGDRPQDRRRPELVVEADQSNEPRGRKEPVPE